MAGSRRGTSVLEPQAVFQNAGDGGDDTMGSARYDPDRRGYRIFVGNLAGTTSHDDLANLFSPYGPIVDIWLASNPPGFGFVVFKGAGDAERAVQEKHGTIYMGRVVKVQHARMFKDRTATKAAGENSASGSSRSRSRTRSSSRSRFSSRSSRSWSRSSSRLTFFSRIYGRGSRARSNTSSRSRSRSRSRSHGSFVTVSSTASSVAHSGSRSKSRSRSRTKLRCSHFHRHRHRRERRPKRHHHGGRRRRSRRGKRPHPSSRQRRQRSRRRQQQRHSHSSSSSSSSSSSPSCSSSARSRSSTAASDRDRDRDHHHHHHRRHHSSASRSRASSLCSPSRLQTSQKSSALPAPLPLPEPPVGPPGTTPSSSSTRRRSRRRGRRHRGDGCRHCRHHHHHHRRPRRRQRSEKRSSSSAASSYDDGEGGGRGGGSGSGRSVSRSSDDDVHVEGGDVKKRQARRKRRPERKKRSSRRRSWQRSSRRDSVSSSDSSSASSSSSRSPSRSSSRRTPKRTTTKKARKEEGASLTSPPPAEQEPASTLSAPSRRAGENPKPCEKADFAASPSGHPAESPTSPHSIQTSHKPPGDDFPQLSSTVTVDSNQVCKMDTDTSSVRVAPKGEEGADEVCQNTDDRCGSNNAKCDVKRANLGDSVGENLDSSRTRLKEDSLRMRENVDFEAVNQHVSTNPQVQKVTSDSGHQSVNSVSGHQTGKNSDGGNKTVYSDSGIQSLTSDCGHQTVNFVGGHLTVNSGGGRQTADSNSGIQSVNSNGGHQSLASDGIYHGVCYNNNRSDALIQGMHSDILGKADSDRLNEKFGSDDVSQKEHLDQALTVSSAVSEDACIDSAGIEADAGHRKGPLLSPSPSPSFRRTQIRFSLSRKPTAPTVISSPETCSTVETKLHDSPTKRKSGALTSGDSNLRPSKRTRNFSTTAATEKYNGFGLATTATHGSFSSFAGGPCKVVSPPKQTRKIVSTTEMCDDLGVSTVGSDNAGPVSGSGSGLCKLSPLTPELLVEDLMMDVAHDLNDVELPTDVDPLTPTSDKTSITENELVLEQIGADTTITTTAEEDTFRSAGTKDQESSNISCKPAKAKDSETSNKRKGAKEKVISDSGLKPIGTRDKVMSDTGLKRSITKDKEISNTISKLTETKDTSFKLTKTKDAETLNASVKHAKANNKELSDPTVRSVILKRPKGKRGDTKSSSSTEKGCSIANHSQEQGMLQPKHTDEEENILEKQSSESAESHRKITKDRKHSKPAAGEIALAKPLEQESEDIASIHAKEHAEDDNGPKLSRSAVTCTARARSASDLSGADSPLRRTKDSNHSQRKIVRSSIRDDGFKYGRGDENRDHKNNNTHRHCRERGGNSRLTAQFSSFQSQNYQEKRNRQSPGHRNTTTYDSPHSIDRRSVSPRPRARSPHTSFSTGEEKDRSIYHAGQHTSSFRKEKDYCRDEETRAYNSYKRERYYDRFREDRAHYRHSDHELLISPDGWAGTDPRDPNFYCDSEERTGRREEHGSKMRQGSPRHCEKQRGSSRTHESSSTGHLGDDALNRTRTEKSHYRDEEYFERRRGSGDSNDRYTKRTEQYYRESLGRSEHNDPRRTSRHAEQDVEQHRILESPRRVRERGEQFFRYESAATDFIDWPMRSRLETDDSSLLRTSSSLRERRPKHRDWEGMTGENTVKRNNTAEEFFTPARRVSKRSRSSSAERHSRFGRIEYGRTRAPSREKHKRERRRSDAESNRESGAKPSGPSFSSRALSSSACVEAGSGQRRE